MTKTPAQAKLDAVLDEIQTAPDSRREELKNKFFEAAIDMWNEDIAGSVELADGRTVKINEI